MAEERNAKSNPQLSKLVEELKTGKVQRRDFLRKVVAMGVSTSVAYAALGQASAAAQIMQGVPTTLALGEETSDHGHHQDHGHDDHGHIQPSTRAMGEEGQPPNVTTQALGEETTHPPHHPPHHDVTTYAVGEEHTSTMHVGEEGQPPPTATTYAVGEETTPPPTATTYALGEETTPPPTATSYAIGEETTPPPTATTYAIGEETTPPPTATTMALGEETQPTPTTLAVGEEGGGVQICPHTGQPIYPAPQRRWNGFRRW